MTLFDILVPLIALAVAGVGVLVLRHSDHALGDDKNHHPAE